jgi:hypothetical protein
MSRYRWIQVAALGAAALGIAGAVGVMGTAAFGAQPAVRSLRLAASTSPARAASTAALTTRDAVAGMPVHMSYPFNTTCGNERPG